MANVMSAENFMKKRNHKLDLFDVIDEDLCDALVTIHKFIQEVTGESPAQTEIAAALKRYFVLNEIKEHIVMDRQKRSV
jgi:hypothetical protein